MLYRNKRTGAIVDLPAVVTGEVWEKVEEAKAPKKAPKEVRAEETEVITEEKPKAKAKTTKTKRSKKK